MSEEDDKALLDALKFDPLDTARSIMGTESHRSYMALGLLMSQHSADRKNRMLTERNDTTMGDSVERYMSIVEGLGFKTVLEIPFIKADVRNEAEERSETYRVLAREDGLLLTFDTFEGKRVNSAHLYYQWKPNDYRNAGKVTSSGGYYPENPDDSLYDTPVENMVWAGSHDAREALAFNIAGLEQNGVFRNPWPVGDTFLWLCHHGDDDDSYKEISDERISMMPEWVQTMINRSEPSATHRI